MKAFISHSINDSEQFVLTLLSDKLREKGFSLTSSFSGRFPSSSLDTLAAMQIKEASLFIGIITASGLNHLKVISEHNLAVSMKVPALLLVEKNIQMPPDFVNYNVIFFNRQFPFQAIEEINRNIRHVTNTTAYTQNGASQNAIAWLFGGLALIGLITLLSSSKD